MLAGCAPTPKQIEDTTDPIPMYPDYTDIMIPTNIAPLNFLLRNDADAMQVTLKGESKEIQLSFGKKAIFPLNLWESLLEQEVGNRLQITVVARIKGKWLRYPSFYWQVVPEKLDSYISYRLIEPGYEVLMCGEHFTLSVNVYTCSFGLFQQFFEVFQIMAADKDTGIIADT